ncbi:unnamed protein product [Chrysoparadoxa australica]
MRCYAWAGLGLGALCSSSTAFQFPGSTQCLRRRNRQASSALRMSSPSEPSESKYSVVFMRHGESQWNASNRFIGWGDCSLTERGEEEARKAARSLMDAGIEIDEIFCSYLKRSIKTSWLIASEMDVAWIPVTPDWRLNEQMYGALQGLYKRETVLRYGVDTVQNWRRSYETAPPARKHETGYFPPDDPKYKHLTELDIPASWCGSAQTESLKDAQARSWEVWTKRILPRVREGKSILVVAHGNLIRALVKRLEQLPNDSIKSVNIPRAVPLVYSLDESFRPVLSSTPSAIPRGPLRGRYIGEDIAQIALAARAASTEAQLGLGETEEAV